MEEIYFLGNYFYKNVQIILKITYTGYMRGKTNMDGP